MNDRSRAAEGIFRTDVAGDDTRRYRDLVNAIGDGIYELDSDGRFTAANDGFLESVGYAREELLGEHVSLVLSESGAARVDETIRTLHATGGDGDAVLELPLRTANGETRASEHRLNPVPEKGDGDGPHVVGVVRPLENGAHRGAEPVETSPDHTLANILGEADVGVFVLDSDFEVAWIDETIEQYFGVDRTDVVGRDKRQLIAEEIRNVVADPDAFVETVLATYDDNTYLEQFECRITGGEDREERWLEHLSKPIDSGPYAGGRVELYYDVTEQHRRASQLRRLHAAVREWLEETTREGVAERACYHLTEIVDLEINGVFLYDEAERELRPVAWSDPAGSVFDTLPTFAENEGIAWEVFETGQSEVYTDVSAHPEVYNPDTPIRSEIILPIEDHGVVIIGSEQRDAFDDNDLTLAKLVASSLEATFDRIRHERTLESERDLRRKLRRRERRLDRYRAYTDDILNTIDDTFYVLDAEGSLQRWNDSVCEVTGYSDAEIESMHVLGFFDDNDRAEIAEAIADGFETGLTRVQAELLTKDGERVPYEFVASRLDDPEGNPVLVGIGRDVAEREKREAELERRARQQQVVADLGQSALETDDLDELMDEASRQVADVLDVEYCKVLDLDPDERELLLRQGVGWREGIVGSATVDADDNSQAGYTLCSEEPVVVDDLESETRFSGPELLTAHGVESGISTIIGSADDPWGILGTHDVDAQSFTEEDVNFVQSVANVLAEAIERRRYQDELERTIGHLEESNERLEQFAYAASHDLQEPLRMVSSYLQLIERRYGDELDEDGREFLEFAVDGAERMRAMIEGLLEYSRVETRGDPFESVDLDAVLENVLEDLQLRIEESGAEIETERLPRVVGDASQLRQVFQNLLENAIEYTGEEPPRISISVDRDRTKWRISVHDEGIGIEPDDQERIFEVFQRLHSREEYEGTGIGLALCQRIIERHGGDIWAESDPGKGATFSFTLPLEGRSVCDAPGA